MSVLILDRHDLVRKITLVHVKVHAVHGDQFDESYVVGLSLRVRYVIAEHEAASLGRMCVEIDIHP